MSSNLKSLEKDEDDPVSAAAAAVDADYEDEDENEDEDEDEDEDGVEGPVRNTLNTNNSSSLLLAVSEGKKGIVVVVGYSFKLCMLQ